MDQQNPSATPVCRNINLRIENIDHYGMRRGSFVAPVAVSSAVHPVPEFLNLVFPGTKIEHVGRAKMVRLGYQVSPSSLFFQAVHKAFSDHHPFALRPEVLMYLITSTVAETVRRYPEEYRGLFTTSDTKQLIKIDHNGLVRGDPSSPWHEVFPLFNVKLREKVPAGIMNHMLPRFSTSTSETDAVSMVSFMDAASRFFDYETHTLCGIPQIRLLGTPEDWEKLKTSAAMLAEMFSKHLSLYFQHLLPVLATLATQANGAPQDDEFWKSIYKFRSESGTATFNGWITVFLNYIQTPEVKGEQYIKASKGELVQKADDLFNWRDQGDAKRWGMKGLPSGCAPSHVSTVPFIWNYYGTKIDMVFAGGVLGVDNEDGYLTPALSYAVLETAK